MRPTIDTLKNYFKENIGPIFCKPSQHLLFRYKRMEGMIGIVKPCYDNYSIEVDWSLDPKWEDVNSFYTSFMTEYSIRDLQIFTLGQDIPQEVDERYDFDWTPSKLGHVVCIADKKFKDLEEDCPIFSETYTKYRNKIGLVIDKIPNLSLSDYIMITFTDKNESSIINIPTRLLTRLPDSFRPAEKKKIATVIKPPLHKPDYELGQIVRVNSSVQDESFMGLLGFIKEIHELPIIGFQTNHSYEYTVDFNTLPNRNLSLCEGENGMADNGILILKKLPERQLSKWDEKISDKSYFGLYRLHNKREKVWVPCLQKEGTVHSTSAPKKSLGEGMSIKVKIDKFNHELSCRDVDYKYDPDALLSVLSDNFVDLGIEEDKRNPNIPKQTLIYIYVFETINDIGKNVKFRILLGELLKRKSVQKKFTRSMISGKISHPWQIRRYLKPDSLGYLYEILNAKDYLKKVVGFCGGE